MDIEKSNKNLMANLFTPMERNTFPLMRMGIMSAYGKWQILRKNLIVEPQEMEHTMKIFKIG